MLNIRVYGILVTEANQILVSDEYIRGSYITKFPGGGLEFGEGTRDCLKREFLEEMNLRVEVGNHIYTTDYFQVSAFNPSHQIISIYYYVTALEEITVPLRENPFEFDTYQMAKYQETKEIETFRLIDLNHFSDKDVLLPIDKIVAKIILQNHS
ncbi:MAG: NUDIX domain-containing protein [Chitinophagaceae bacterium]|nr:NUDIX domain-containing protein [Chitinophagaceae bacterium]